MSLVLAMLAASALHSGPDEGRLTHALTLAPSVQLNPKFTEHHGTHFSYAVGRDRWAATLVVQTNWVRGQHRWNRELILKTREAAEPATGVLIPWAVLPGLRLSPIAGELDEYGVGFEGTVDVAAGYGARSIRLGPGTAVETEAAVDARPTGSGAVGISVHFADRLSLRAELRSLFGASRIEHVNGCSSDDLEAMERELRSGRPTTSTHVSDGCRAGEFAPAHVPLALSALRTGSTDTLFILSANIGLTATF